MARPREYDRERVLTEAMNVFRGTGYFGTNMSQLIEATRLNPGSLYGAFNSKEELFLAALDHYGTRSVEKVRADLYGQSSPKAGVRAWIERIASEISGQGQHGCLLVNTAVELSDRNAAIRDRVNLHLGEIRNLVAARLEEAREAGEISAEKDPFALADFLLCAIWGLRVWGETFPEVSRVDGVKNQLFSLLEE
ncbi:MAG: TetR/AcrR family transcriptional regulator [Burkholderiales bacterium]|nr:TetR/AcrR family transcriptional regulator [Burkholderiales bacterium]